jgi:hypothetical protein
MKNSGFLNSLTSRLCLLAVACIGAGTYYFSSSASSEKISKEEFLANSTSSPTATQFQLPLYFEKNEGQIDPQVKFLSRGQGYTFYFTPQEVVMALKGSLDSALVKIQFVGAEQNPQIAGVDEQEYKTHYYRGNDPAQWHTHIPNFAKVSYPNLYPGIDAIFYGDKNRFEYDICVAPGANPQDVKLRVEGAQKLSIDASGNLCMQITEAQHVQMQKPVIYQMIEGDRVFVDGEFVLLAQNDIGFEIGPYNLAQTLIIDPVLLYSTFLGGSNQDIGHAIAVDSAGNAYVTGATFSINFPVVNAIQPSNIGNPDVFVTKINSAGSALIFSTYLGGVNNNQGLGIALDSSSDAYITGSTSSPNFPITAGVFQSLMTGNTNAFITKVTSTGALSYSTYLGGNNSDFGNAIAVDGSGNAYIAGFTSSTTFPLMNPIQATLNGFNNAFITKINSNATALIYSTYLGGSGTDHAQGIALDGNADAYITGYTDSTNFPITSGAFQTALGGFQDVFIAKINSSGSALDYSTYLGGSGADQGLGIAVDGSGSAYVTGFTGSTHFPVTLGAFQTTMSAARVGFITKMNPTGAALVYSTYLGGTSFDEAHAIAIDTFGNAYVVGTTFSTNFPTVNPIFSTGNIFLSEMNSTGTDLLFSTHFGGVGVDTGSGVALDPIGNTYLTGVTSGIFFTTPGAFQTTYGGNNDAFIIKVSSIIPIVTSIDPTEGPTTGGTYVTITGANLTPNTQVFFGPNEATVICASSTSVVAISPPGIGTVDVTVTTDVGTSATSPADQFTYTGPVFPPTDLTGIQKANKFLTQTDIVNILRWKMPDQGNPPAFYEVFRNAALTDLAGTVPGAIQVKFEDHNRRANTPYSYWVISVDDFGNRSSPATVIVPPVRSNYASPQVPLYFEKNEGQVDAQVKYLARGKGYLFYFTPQEVRMALKNGEDSDSPAALLKMQFVGAEQNPHIIGVDKQEYKAHYYRGNDPAKWHTDIPSFAKVSYEKLYPGIDALFYGDANIFEYDICVAPGGKPQDIRIHMEGMQKLSIDEEGNLCIQVKENQQLRMQKPIVYQMLDGEKEFVSGDFVLLTQNDVGFAIGSYDLTQTLIIDPVIVYSTFLGGSDQDIGHAIAVDSMGNAYVTGQTASLNFPVMNAFQPSIAGDFDVFITKVNPTGTAFVFSTYLGGNNTDLGFGIALDSSNNAYITGNTFSPDFPITAGVFQPLIAGSINAFITKVTSTGALSYSTYLGGNNFDFGNAIAVDSSGNAYITGVTSSTNFPLMNPIQATLNGLNNAFITKINSNATALVYSTYLGGSGNDQAQGIALDNNSNAYIAGYTDSANFPTTFGAFQTALGGAVDAFITKINSLGSALDYSTYLGGTNDDQALGIAVDGSGSAYVTGFTQSTNFPVTSGAFQTTLIGSTNAFITKVNPTGSALTYSTYLGGNNLDQGNAIAVDMFGNAYVTGQAFSTNFPLVNPISFTGNILLSEINPTGTSLLFSTRLGGTFDSGNGIALDPLGNIYLTGQTLNSGFSTTPGVVQPVYGGNGGAGDGDAFIIQISSTFPVVTSINPAQGPTAGGTLVTITGINLTPGTEVFFGATPAIILCASSDVVIAISPPGSGTVDVTVATDNGVSAISPADEFTYEPAPPAVFPPQDLEGTQIANRFLTQTDFVNILTWKKPTQGNPPVFYKIFRNAALTELAGVVSCYHTLEFVDHNRKPGKTYTYWIVSLDGFGNISLPAVISVPPIHRH